VSVRLFIAALGEPDREIDLCDRLELRFADGRQLEVTVDGGSIRVYSSTFIAVRPVAANVVTVAATKERP
jgi:uncharacterized protein Veg